MKYFDEFYTVESVTNGHPDKVCDQISDAILDAYLKQDKNSRVAVECFGAHGALSIGGEVTSNADIDVKQIARNVYKTIGYNDTLDITTHIITQSVDIAQGVNTGGAGDQGIMYGYATNETDEFLSYGVVLAHKLARSLEKLRTSGEITWLEPDGKTQVTIKDGEVQSVLVSTQHIEGVTQDEIRKTLIERLIIPIVGEIDDKNIFINPTGKFVIGGFTADTGLTGRKVMVDTYGGLIPHGGGCFSGKDASKVDRSGAYMARFVAKNIVANGYAKECLVSIAYAIGKSEPLMVRAIDESGVSLEGIINENFDFTPNAIREKLQLDQSIFAQTATYGHFGKENLPWEEIINIA